MVRKKTGLCGQISLRGGRGLTQTHSIFFSVFSISGAYKMAKKTVKNVKITKLGGGGKGSATWEFFPHNPVFFSDHVPKLCLLKWLFCMEATKMRCFLQHRSVISRNYCGQSQIVISKYHNIRSIRTSQRC